MNNDQLVLQDVRSVVPNDLEVKIIRLINKWKSGEKSFCFHTSGSTGSPKKIEIAREVMEYSARVSLSALDPQNNFEHSLICINTDFIGGTMAVIRALVAGHDITAIDPIANPLKAVTNEQVDLVSMVPLQIQTTLKDNPKLFESVNTTIIGGAPLAQKWIRQLEEISHTNFYLSYGMTETCSHIALMNIQNEDTFRLLGDVATRQDHRGCLAIKGTVTAGKWIQTNDLVSMIDDQRFIWNGRADNIINTGGYKVQVEELENKLSNLLDIPLMITGLPDEQLGQRVVLLLETENQTINIPETDNIHPYERPKDLIHMKSFVYTNTDKINRQETLKLLKD